MGNKEQFNKFDAKDGGHVTFRNNDKGKIVGIGEISNPQYLSIHNVLLVDGLKYNLLNISQSLVNCMTWEIRSLSILEVALLVVLMRTDG